MKRSKPLKVAHLKDILQKLDAEDISISKAVEMLNDIAFVWAKEHSQNFVKWLNDGVNPFIYISSKNKWVQACGNSTEYTTEKLYDMFAKEELKYKP